MRRKLKELSEKEMQDELVASVLKDFRKRQQERKSFEAQWQLNMNFYMGNQYCTIGHNSEVEEYEKQFFWQEKEAYNHIQPIMEVRLAKLERVRPTMSIIPATNDDKDLKTAKISKKIVNSIYSKKEISSLISEATHWSEICGTAFYKIVWNSNKGNPMIMETGEILRGGEVDISVCSPFEIFPESSSCADVNDCRSIIHAKAYHKDDIKRIWGVDVEGKEVNIFSLDSVNSGFGGLGYSSKAPKIISTTRSDYELVIEKYEAPSDSYPNGRLIIIAGETLIFDGELPFENGIDGERVFPFIKQVSSTISGCFWGGSVVERLIPVQRAYNAIKNRKHEFLNRISMGVLTVEDGSVDIDNLEEEGLSPGKILVYRQGANTPRYMTSNSVPVDFTREEERLLDEFTTISGVSDLIRNLSSYTNMSGTALQIIIEQDDSRISTTAEKIRNAIKQMAQQTLRLYKQFATMPRYRKIVGENGEIELFYFTSNDISSDDICFETESEISDTLAQRRNMVFELLNAGLLADESGRLSNRMRAKVLDLLGFGVWESSQDLNELHMKKADKENLKIIDGEKVKVLEIDNHDIHISQHTAYMLGGEFEKACNNNPKLTEKFLEHIREHKKFEKFNEILSEKEN